VHLNYFDKFDSSLAVRTSPVIQVSRTLEIL